MFNTQKDAENSTFWKRKGHSSKWEMFMPTFFGNVVYEKHQGSNFKGSQGFLDNYCPTDNINSLGSKRSIETNISKNRCFHGDKRFWPIFLRIIESDKPHGTFYKVPQGYQTNTLEVERLVLQDLRRCWIHNFLKKGDSSDEKKSFDQTSRVVEYDKPQQISIGVHRSFWQPLCKFLGHMKSTKVFKRKAVVLMRKRLWPFFSHITHSWRHRVTFC